MTGIPASLTLEARAHRLFLAQGLFAERGLLPTATPDRRMLATDIDVLVSEYGSGFHLTRRHVECKSGKFALLDRILWLNGVRTLLRADSSYLVATDIDLSASDFARGARRAAVYSPAFGRVGTGVGDTCQLLAVPK